MPAPRICSCGSNGKGERWLSRCPSWWLSIRTNQPPKRSATGITGFLRATFSNVRFHHKIARTMPRTSPKSQPTWTDLKAQLAGFDRKGLLGLIQDLYAANKHNRTFLHTRFGLG